MMDFTEKKIKIQHITQGEKCGEMPLLSPKYRAALSDRA